MTNNITLNGKLHDKSKIDLNPKLWQFVQNEDNLVKRYNKTFEKNHESYLKYKNNGSIKVYQQNRKLKIDFKCYENGLSWLRYYIYKYNKLKNSDCTKKFECFFDYTIKDFILNFNSKFNLQMSWLNYGKYWQIDHIVSYKAFGIKKYGDKEFQKCFALDNLRPLEIKINLERSRYRK